MAIVNVKLVLVMSSFLGVLLFLRDNHGESRESPKVMFAIEFFFVVEISLHVSLNVVHAAIFTPKDMRHNGKLFMS